MQTKSSIRNFVLGIFFVMFSALSLTSCQTWDNHGLPSSVSFGPEGGRQIFKSDGDWLVYIEIQKKSGTQLTYSHPNPENDSLIVSYDWLTVKTKEYSPNIEIIVAPNTGKKNRTLDIVGSFGKDNAMIKVKQKH